MTVAVDNPDLRAVFKPLFIFMKLTGLYYLPEKIQKTSVHELGDGKIQIASKFVRDMLKNNVWKIYTVLIVLLGWILAVRSALGLFVGNPEVIPGFIMYRIAGLGYHLQFALEITILFKMFHSSERYHKFLRDWNDFCVNTAAHGCDQAKVTRKLRRYAYVTCVICGTMELLTVVSAMGGMFGTNKIARESMEVMVDPLKRTLVNKIITVIGLAFVTIPWLVVIMLFSSTCKALTYQFENLAEGLGSLVSRNPDNYPKNLPFLRMAHLNLCDLVETVEHDFKHILAVSFTLNISMSLFLGYHMVKSSMDIVNLCLMATWISGNLLKIYMMSFSAAHLHDKVSFWEDVDVQICFLLSQVDRRKSVREPDSPENMNTHVHEANVVFNLITTAAMDATRQSTLKVHQQFNYTERATYLSLPRQTLPYLQRL